MLKKLEELQVKREELKGELKKYERSDPKILKKIDEDTKIAKDSVNRWTDNLFAIL